MENLICNLCAGSPEIDLYVIQLNEKQQKIFDKETIMTDICIGKEIKFLVDNRVITKGCCCGHGKEKPSCLINNDKDSIDIIKQLGYKIYNYKFSNLKEICLKTDIQFELRKLLKNKIFKYLEN
ncbi:hypothetical protein ACFHWD_03915 [Clostridium sp. MT-14]|uniref:hypothetical protein n=1 Tax=Clostridium sp. MT-14 TaxID=3348360 RepID=UPI0035F28BD0